MTTVSGSASARLTCPRRSRQTGVAPARGAPNGLLVERQLLSALGSQRLDRLELGLLASSRPQSTEPAWPLDPPLPARESDHILHKRLHDHRITSTKEWNGETVGDDERNSHGGSALARHDDRDMRMDGEQVDIEAWARDIAKF